MLRSALKALLAPYPDIQVTGEAANGRELLERVATQPPDVVLMDINMPGLNGIEATARLAETHPRVRVIIVSAHEDAPTVLRALRAGARGFVLKTSEPDDLATAIREVSSNRVHYGPSVAELLAKWAVTPELAEDPLARLSPRQREVLQLIAEGHSTKEIAHALGVSVSTVDTHRTELMRRLNVRDVAGVVRVAISSGLIRSS